MSHVSEICPEMSKALDTARLYWMTCPFRVGWKLKTGWKTRVTVPIFKVETKESATTIIVTLLSLTSLNIKTDQQTSYRKQEKKKLYTSTIRYLLCALFRASRL